MPFMLQPLLDFVFPRRSLLGHPGCIVATNELLSMKAQPRTEEWVELQRRGIRGVDRLTTLLPYQCNTILTELLRRWKFLRQRAYAESIAAVIDCCEEVWPEGDCVLCPVPLHWSRRFHRGFNQAEVIAAALRERTGLRVCNVLRRARATGHQSWRSKAERKVALCNAFRVVDPQSLPTHVVLVDDVVTTGSTLSECAQALRKAGVRHVEAWALARD